MHNAGKGDVESNSLNRGRKMRFWYSRRHKAIRWRATSPIYDEASPYEFISDMGALLNLMAATEKLLMWEAMTRGTINEVLGDLALSRKTATATVEMAWGGTESKALEVIASAENAFIKGASTVSAPMGAQ